MVEELKLPKSEEEFVDHYIAFGWQVLKQDKKEIVLTRDTNMAHYSELKLLQGTYQSHKDRMKKYPEKNVGLTIVLYLCLLIPGMIYLEVMNKKIRKVRENNAIEREYMKSPVKEGKKILGIPLEEKA